MPESAAKKHQCYGMSSEKSESEATNSYWYMHLVDNENATSFGFPREGIFIFNSVWRNQVRYGSICPSKYLLNPNQQPSLPIRLDAVAHRNNP